MKTLLLMMVAVATTNCATPAVPAPRPHAPSSLAAPAGYRPSVTLALENDPPLPGEHAAGWDGLDGTVLPPATTPAAQPSAPVGQTTGASPEGANHHAH